MFSGTMFTRTEFRRSSRSTKLYSINFGYARAFPMTSRSEAHKTLLVLFTWEGDAPACICVNVLEMIQDKFYQKVKDAACQLSWL